MTTYFISGHLDLTRIEFRDHYLTQLEKTLDDPGARYVVGDAPRGGDLLAQQWLLQNDVWRSARLYHMFTEPRACAWKIQLRGQWIGGFKTDEERDAAMTVASDVDIAWVRPGREKSGTARNLERREKAKKQAEAWNFFRDLDPEGVLDVIGSPRVWQGSK